MTAEIITLRPRRARGGADLTQPPISPAEFEREVQSVRLTTGTAEVVAFVARPDPMSQAREVL